MADKLTYKDIQLGERAVEAYKAGKTPIEIAKTLPTYLNTREAYKGFTTTDLVSATVLGGVNGFLMGKKGTGKSQLAEDLTRHYFGGKINKGGEGFITEAHNDFELEPLFVRFDTKTGEKELKGTHSAVFYVLEELTRAHAAVQNQFYSFGNGRLIINGFDEQLGRDGYSCALATGNDPRNQKNVGTFESDEALLSRFAFVLDLDDKYFRLTDEDRFWIEHIKPATPGLTLSKQGRNLTDKVIQAHSEIEMGSLDLGLESEAAFQYLAGLRTCPGLVNGGTEEAQDKEDISWPDICMSDCGRKASQTRTGKLGDSPLCSLIRAPDTRVLNAARKYAAALGYVAKLKNPETEVNGADLAFMAFELTGAYQGLLNERVLESTDFNSRNNTMMKEVSQALKEDFRKHQDYICHTLSQARQGNDSGFFIEEGGRAIPITSEEAETTIETNKRIEQYLAEGGDSSAVPEKEKVISIEDVFCSGKEVPLDHIQTQRDLLIENKEILDKQDQIKEAN